MGKSIFGDFFDDLGKGFDKVLNGEILEGVGDIVGGTLKGAVRTIGYAGKTIGAVSEALAGDSAIAPEDIPDEDRPALTVLSVVAMLAKMAKADGRVVKAETQLLTAWLEDRAIEGEDKKGLQKFANEQAKDRDTSIYKWAQVFSAATNADEEAAIEVYLLLWRMARVVGKVSEEQGDILEEIPEDLRLDSKVYDLVREHPEVIDECTANPDTCQGQTLESCYAVLGCPVEASNDEVKRCYKKQMAQYHPDVISGKDLAPGFVEFANQQTAKINAAYEAIRAARKMR